MNRDRRTQKIQTIEYDYLAPDTVNEIFDAITILHKLSPDQDGCYYIEGFENSNRKAQIIKQPESLKLFSDLIIYYGVTQLLDHIKKNNSTSFDEMKKSISTKITRTKWINVGGQLMTEGDLGKIKQHIKSDKIQSWQQVHDMYKKVGADYFSDKLEHSYTSLLEVLNITSKQFTTEVFKTALQNAVIIKEWICKGIYESREKDYSNPFRKMVYDTKLEMDTVIGKIEDNSFIQEQTGELDIFKKNVKEIIKKFHL
jgi:hypothetical protein